MGGDSGTGEKMATEVRGVAQSGRKIGIAISPERLAEIKARREERRAKRKPVEQVEYLLVDGQLVSRPGKGPINHG